MRRVVVTGLGMVSPLGCGVEPTWKRILNSESGARKIDTFDVSDLTSRIACVIPRGDGSDGTFNPPGFRNPAMAFFAHPLVVRLSYFPSLDYKPQLATRTAFHHAKRTGKRLKT